MRRLRQLRNTARLAMEARGERITARGIGLGSRQPLTVRYLGLPGYFEHLAPRLFEGSVEELERESAWNGLAFRQFEDSKMHKEGLDLLIAHLPRPYGHLVGGRALEVPCWIIQKAQLDRPWDDVVASFRKNTRTTDLRKVRKYSLTPHITRDLSDIRDFYDRMYVPHAKRRFGPLSVVDDFDEVVEDVKSRGELLLVHYEGAAVGGCELVSDGQYMQLLSLGVVDELPPSVADAALSGIYLFALQHAHARGCRELGFALTLPNVKDGIYRYKRKWGTAIHDDFSESSFFWQPRTFGVAVQAFLVEHPWMYRSSAGLVAKVLLPGPIDSRELHRLAEGYISPGLARVEFYGHHADPRPPSNRDALPYVTWHDLSTTDDALRLFCRAD
ncbi:MAG: hypothetical protein OXR73_35375 [Myxococcales bacterium]|nr:hypothetical protein [Myxococcales bacterium]